MLQRLSILTLLLALAAFAAAQETPQPTDEQDAPTDVSNRNAESAEDKDPDDPYASQYGNYPQEPRIVGGPTDVGVDLAGAFPNRNSVFGDRYSAKKFFQWKERLYEKTGLKLAFSYQSVYLRVTDVATDSLPLPEPNDNWAAMGWLLLEGSWSAFNKDRDFQGGIVAALDWRHAYGDLQPAFFQVPSGSLWPNEFVYVAWDPWFAALYWEQWGKKDRLVFRVGTQTVPQYLDFFRFKDGRTSFTNGQTTIPATTMAWPGPGFGAMFEWWPVKDSPLYVIGTLNDMNADPGSFSWDNAWDYGQFFYAVEVGAHIGEFPKNFDHVHLTLYYSDERDTQAGGSAFVPNKAGWGFKAAGEKQWGKLVGFANYSYNTAEGGHFGITLGRHGINAGLARLQPFGIRGEAAVGATWVNPIQEFDTGLPLWENRRDQFGVEAYWKILLTPDLWITPGAQFIWDPSFNLEQDFIAVGSFKFRLFF
jgi:hypothetical protein